MIILTILYIIISIFILFKKIDRNQFFYLISSYLTLLTFFIYYLYFHDLLLSLLFMIAFIFFNIIFIIKSW